MSFIGEVKCARCDRKYSGVRSRCPYCGARRIGRGKYSEEGDNSRGKMLIGVLILAVLVVAAAVLLLTTEKPPADDALDNSYVPSVSMPDDLGNTSVTSNSTISPTPPTASDDDENGDESPSPEVYEIVSLAITYANTPKTDITANVAERVPLRARVEPIGIDEPIIWTSSNTSVFQVVTDNVEGLSATVSAIGVGTATLTVSVGGKEATCIIRVK